ncbi:cupin domain-containing protein [Sorangium sp. So ce406]|uniref:cupin domain-containing protein n=1 Tax=Sorangium sp. So ce406 TaxID=3133311 RepID=UPI003F5BFB2D
MDLFSGPATVSPIVRRGTREALRSEWSKATAESLTPASADHRLLATMLTIDPGGRTGTLRQRAGVRAFAYCIRGTVELVFGERREEALLEAGDSVLLDDPRLTAWENCGESTAEVLVVSAGLVGESS